MLSHGVWRYCRWCPSYQDVEALMAARGISLTSEAVRSWCRKCGQAYANTLRRRCPRPGDTWHLDEVLRTIHGERHSLWRAVDHDGHVLDILPAQEYRLQMTQRFQTWREITGSTMAA